jgi:hypothetical protein
MTANRLQRVARAITAFMVASAVLYGLLGAGLVYQAYAQQTRSWIIPTPNKPQFAHIPTGSDDVTVKQYYEYNALRHLGSMEEQYFVDPYYEGTMYLAIGVVLLVSYFLAFVWYAKTRNQGDLYPVEVYNAYLTERNGPIDMFNWVTWAVLLSYMAYYTVINLMFAQYY